MHAARRANVIFVGEKVTVLTQDMPDPEDSTYTDCRISYKGRIWVLICVALGE